MTFRLSVVLEYEIVEKKARGWVVDVASSGLESSDH